MRGSTDETGTADEIGKEIVIVEISEINGISVIRETREMIIASTSAVIDGRMTGVLISDNKTGAGIPLKSRRESLRSRRRLSLGQSHARYCPRSLLMPIRFTTGSRAMSLLSALVPTAKSSREFMSLLSARLL
jgi:hypothetical protein